MLDNLYQDIGEKIKGWAKWVFIIGAIVSVISAVIILSTAEDLWVIIVGLLALFVGPIASWIFSWLLYGFGEIIDTLDVIAYNTYRKEDEEA